MKRTCLKKNTNSNEQTTCELHQVKKLINEMEHNRQIISNFEIFYR